MNYNLTLKVYVAQELSSAPKGSIGGGTAVSTLHSYSVKLGVRYCILKGILHLSPENSVLTLVRVSNGFVLLNGSSFSVNSCEFSHFVKK